MDIKTIVVLIVALGYWGITTYANHRQGNLLAGDLPEDLRPKFASYYGEGDYKTFAWAYSDDGRWAFGTAYNASSQASADNWAIKRCSYAADKDGIDAICKIYARGGRVIR